MRASEIKATIAKIEETLKKIQSDESLTSMEKHILVDDINYLFHGVSKWREKILKIINLLEQEKK